MIKCFESKLPLRGLDMDLYGKFGFCHITGMGWCAAVDYDCLESGLLKEDTESSEVVDCGSLFHSGMDLVAKRCCSSFVEQRRTTSLSYMASYLVALGFLSRHRSTIGTAT